jgi:hypothetical protein
MRAVCAGLLDGRRGKNFHYSMADIGIAVCQRSPKLLIVDVASRNGKAAPLIGPSPEQVRTRHPRLLDGAAPVLAYQPILARM